MREKRPKYSELSPEARRKAVARTYANVYQSRGLLQEKPCEKCGAKAEKSHDDYEKPLKIRWLCKGCRLGLVGMQSHT